MNTLPFHPPCDTCRGYGFINDEAFKFARCDTCHGRGFNPRIQTANEDNGRADLHDRRHEQMAGPKVLVLGLGAVLVWIAGCAVGYFIWKGLT